MDLFLRRATEQEKAVETVAQGYEQRALAVSTHRHGPESSTLKVAFVTAASCAHTHVLVYAQE